ncbi:glycerate kinase I [Raoultella terrigena]|uniref:Glycerate kinase I n=1 Tax=Raoultella terrigena TaxID=577 RepID=A0A3P8KG34_RAOTE|nr:glycerate kinase I [Raoultella terrigena]
MKIVIAPDSYKESLSALGVATAIEQGSGRFIPMQNTSSYRSPTAGGTVEAMVAATQGHLVRAVVTGPLGEPVNAFLRSFRRRTLCLYRNGGGQRPGKRTAGAPVIRCSPPAGGPGNLSATRWTAA